MTDNPPIPWTTEEICRATGARHLWGPDRAVFSAVAIDARAIAADELFLAIRGETHDGHRFVDSALARGVRGILVATNRDPSLSPDQWQKSGITCLAVADTTRALGALAAFHRARCQVPVVAITGSNGKTTTRAMAAQVASQGFETLATRGNFNNHIGLPLTLLDLCPHHQWAVVEMGMNHPGEIAYLAGLCAPRIGVITNIAPAHLEGLGSMEGVMAAKGELLAQMADGGTAILNADDPWSRRLARNHSGTIIGFGQSSEALVRAEEIATQGNETRFSLCLPAGTVPVRLRTPGRFMVANALAAAAVGVALDLSPEMIRQGLEAFTPVAGRMRIERSAAGVNVIDDTYNANPASMTAALETLAALCPDGPSFAALGSMAELGDQAPALHRQVGQTAGKYVTEKLYLTGPMAQEMATGAASAGLAPGNIVCASREEIIRDVTGRAAPGTWILVKGSRSMAMETVARALVGATSSPTG